MTKPRVCRVFQRTVLQALVDIPHGQGSMSNITSDKILGLSKSLQLPEFDLLLMGDGSGTQSHLPCGWAVYSYEKSTHSTLRHFGGVNHGTNNLAELAPYVHALWHHHSLRAKTVDFAAKKSAVRVAIVSDSEVIVRCGNGSYAKNSNQAFWAALEWFTTNGYVLQFFHTRRNTNAVGTAADDLAGRVRKTLLQLETE